ncbi:MAG: DMT family transporter [Luminiphilus sp.]|jgi:drug/metabolite transporter (DMT)-like permease
MTQSDRHAMQLGLGAVMLWSTVATAFSLSLNYLSPLQLVTFATLVSWCFFALRLLSPGRWQALRTTSTKDCLTGLLVGWMNPGLYYLVLFAAYDRLPAQEAMAINYSWGITLALLAAPLLKQKLTLGALFAAGISYVGIVVIATRGAPLSLDLAQPLGVGLALLSTLIWSGYWIINTRLSLNPEVNLFLNFSGALPLLLGLMWFNGVPFPHTWQAWSGGVYVGLFEMGIAFVLWMSAMKATTSTLKISSLIFLSPPLSLLFIWIVAGEPVRNYTLLGLVLILAGLWLQRRAER